ncbi:MAG: hypothetical protein ACKEQK_00480, partial [Candidatus Hodgkinia cicadicola]
MYNSHKLTKSDGGLLLKGLSITRTNNETFTLNITLVVLALGSEPNTKLFPDSAKTTSGFIKTSFDDPSLKGIFPAGSIVE